jgi:rhamnulokinase
MPNVGEAPMTTKCYLGVDLGAESGRVIGGFLNGRTVRLEELHRFENRPVEIANTLRWDVLHLWRDIKDGLSIAGKSHGKTIRSVGVDSWGVDYALLSKNGELVGLPYHYRDPRTRGLLEKSFRKMSRQRIFAQTGLQFLEINTLYQLQALRRDCPEVLKAADCFLMIADFFHWCLSGVRAVEFTNATTTQLLHPLRRSWSAGLLKTFQLPAGIFPAIVKPGTTLGVLRRQVSEQCGLSRLPVVAPATHDTASAVAAVPARFANGPWAYISSGTWSLMGIETRRALLSPNVLENNFTNEGGIDGTYRVLKNIAGLWLVQRCRHAFSSNGQSLSYAQLARLAASARPLRSILDVADPSFVNPPDMPAAIRQFCRRTRQPIPASIGEISRCALESLALKYAEVLETLERIAGHRIEVIHIVGGGSRNGLLNQLAADACNRPVIAGPVEATALGNVLVQAMADGEISSLDQLREIVHQSCGTKTYHSRPSQNTRWQEARERAKRLAFS